MSFTGRRGKGRTSSRKKILICRSPGSGEPEPGTTLYVTPTHSHRGSCPASPGEPGPGCDGRGRGWLSSGQGSSAQKLPDAPAGRAQREQRHAGRASLAGRGRSRRCGRGLRPAGPLHRRCSREGHAARRAPPRWCSPAPVRSWLRRSRKDVGGARILWMTIDPARRGQTSPPLEFSSGPSFGTRASARGPAREVIRPPTGSATHRPVGATY
jgi:hypothetical protein